MSKHDRESMEPRAEELSSVSLTFKCGCEAEIPLAHATTHDIGLVLRDIAHRAEAGRPLWDPIDDDDDGDESEPDAPMAVPMAHDDLEYVGLIAELVAWEVLGLALKPVEDGVTQGDMVRKALEEADRLCRLGGTEALAVVESHYVDWDELRNS